MPHSVLYAAFDADGRCLYVGTTDRHPVLRWAEHVRAKKPWVDDAVRWENLPDVSEEAATRRLKPLYSYEAQATKAPPYFHTDYLVSALVTDIRQAVGGQLVPADPEGGFIDLDGDEPIDIS
jgi:hypothetical protein